MSINRETASDQVWKEKRASLIKAEEGIALLLLALSAVVVLHAGW